MKTDGHVADLPGWRLREGLERIVRYVERHDDEFEPAGGGRIAMKTDGHVADLPGWRLREGLERIVRYVERHDDEFEPAEGEGSP